MIVKGGTVLLGGGDWSPHTVDIEVRDGRIASIGSNLSAPNVLDAHGKLIIPGLVNAHLHLGAQPFRYTAARTSLPDFIAFTDRYYGRHPTPERLMELSSWVTLAEAVTSGTTSVAVSKGWHEVHGAGLTGLCLYPVMTTQTLKSYLEDLEARIVRTQSDCAEYGLGFGIFVPSLLHVTPGLLSRVSDLLDHDTSLRIAFHFLETREERAAVRSRFGMEPIELLSAYGLLSARTILAHCSHVKPDEIAEIHASGAHVVICPMSNTYLRTGLPPLAMFRERNVPISLATDGPATGTTLGLLEHAKVMRNLFPEVELTSADLAEALTSNPAKAIGQEEEVGSLAIGKDANFLLFRDRCFFSPPEDRLSELIFGTAKTPAEVWIKGKCVATNGALTSSKCQEMVHAFQKGAASSANEFQNGYTSEDTCAS